MVLDIAPLNSAQ